MKVTRDQGQCKITVTTEPIFAGESLSALVLEHVTDNDQEVTLDLQHVKMLHSPSLAELARIYVNLRKRGIDLIVTGLNDFNRRLLKTTRLDVVIMIEGE